MGLMSLNNFLEEFLQPTSFKMSQTLRHRKNVLENFGKFISQERHSSNDN